MGFRISFQRWTPYYTTADDFHSSDLIVVFSEVKFFGLKNLLSIV